MGAHLVTGYAGKSHITAADQGQYNAGTVGTGRYVLKTGNMFAAEVVSNNLIKIKDGDLINQGRHIRIAPNDYEECTIDNGLQSVKRNDLIVMRYAQNQDTLVESAQVVVIKGVSGDTAVDPSYTTGDILNGAQTDDYPLYRVKLDGLNIIAVEQLFTTIPAMHDLNTDLTTQIAQVANGEITYIPQFKLVLFAFRSAGINDLSIGIIPEQYRPAKNAYMVGISFSEDALNKYVADVLIKTDGSSLITTDGAGRVRGCGFWFTE